MATMLSCERTMPLGLPVLPEVKDRMAGSEGESCTTWPGVERSTDRTATAFTPMAWSAAAPSVPASTSGPPSRSTTERTRATPAWERSNEGGTAMGAGSTPPRVQAQKARM